MQTKSACRAFCIVARDHRTAVVLRRGPSDQVQLLRWYLGSDSIEPGQWLKGSVYERRCDLTPDGEQLVYFAATHRAPYGTWTAISRPPYFTALALWPKGDAWGGGGVFESKRHLLLNHRSTEFDLPKDFSLPKRFRVSEFGTRSGWGEDSPIYDHRLSRDGWLCTNEGVWHEHGDEAKMRIHFDPPQTWQKSCDATDRVLVMIQVGINRRNGAWNVLRFELLSSNGTQDLGECDWADLLPDGDVIYSKAGQLLRLSAGATEAYLVSDLRENRFEPVTPTQGAMTW